MVLSLSLLETYVIWDHCVRSNWQHLGVIIRESRKDDLFAPYLPQEILEEIHGKVLTGAAPIAKTKWRITGRVAYRVVLVLDTGVHGAKYTV